MHNVLTIPADTPDVTLRELATKSDDIAYFEAVEENREHLSQYDDRTAIKYPTLQHVTNARQNAGDKVRLGIWRSDEQFLGTINGTPDKVSSEIEVGYWLRACMQGNGYATIALKALTNYLAPQYKRVFAEVHKDNVGSVHVLQRAGYTQTECVERDWGPAIVFESKP